MLLNENPCKGCENNHEEIIFKWYGCVGIHTSSLTCPDYVAYHAQRELLGKVVEWLENFGNEPRWVTYKHKAKVIAKELKKELQG